MAQPIKNTCTQTKKKKKKSIKNEVYGGPHVFATSVLGVQKSFDLNVGIFILYHKEIRIWFNRLSILNFILYIM